MKASISTTSYYIPQQAKKMNRDKIHKMNTLFYNRMFFQLKKTIHSPESKSKILNSSVSKANIRITPSSKHKIPKLRINKNLLNININATNKLQISTNSTKQSNISSHITTPIEGPSRINKSLKTQPNSSSVKIYQRSGKVEEYRYKTEEEGRKVEVMLEYQNTVVSVKIKESSTVLELKMQLFKEMLKVSKDNISHLMDLVTFQSISSVQTPDIFTDYWLGQSHQPLSIFLNNNIQAIRLRPLFYPINTREVTLNDYIIYRCIGMGGFSKVYLGKCKLNGKFCALKFVDKNNIKNSTKFIQNERTILGCLDHPNIVTLYHSFETKNYIVFSLEYCPNNQLYQYLRKNQYLGEDQGREVFKQLLSGIEYLHSKKVLYRDLKLENILIDAKGHVKITDFGLSKPNCEEEEITYSYCGSPEYMAPEMLLKQMDMRFRCGHSYEVDYYTLGILLYELLVGSSPFVAKTKKEIYYAALHNEVKFSNQIPLSKEVKSLLKGLLQKNPANRIGSLKGIKEIFEHPWVKKGSTNSNSSVENCFKGQLFREYRQANQPSRQWLQKEYQEEEMGRYQKSYKHIYYQNAKLYKERMNNYLMLEEQVKMFMGKSKSKVITVTNSPVLSRKPSKTFISKNKNPYLRKIK